ncbi:unnamed protein product [Brugia pahangi]|uniref:Extracellular solute-binding protein n=1 Tax=Brugia pahangi TaxID=6280 RepID=A0A0N4T483_BRUPA|nr:unnamed protein product [Brugia pahangi]
MVIWLARKKKTRHISFSTTPLANYGGKHVSDANYVYQGLGISVFKKNAINVARDFAHFLIRQKLLDPTNFPKLACVASMLEATNLDSFARALENNILLKTEENNCITTDCIPSSRIKTEHQRYIEQKAEIALISSPPFFDDFGKINLIKWEKFFCQYNVFLR